MTTAHPSNGHASRLPFPAGIQGTLLWSGKFRGLAWSKISIPNVVFNSPIVPMYYKDSPNIPAATVIANGTNKIILRCYRVLFMAQDTLCQADSLCQALRLLYQISISCTSKFTACRVGCLTTSPRNPVSSLAACVRPCSCIWLLMDLSHCSALRLGTLLLIWRLNS